MKKVLFLSLLLLLPILPAGAQDGMPIVTEPSIARPLGEVTGTPQCFNVVNQAPYQVFGSIQSNYFIRHDGIKARHKSNFRLDSGEFAEFCTSGPFYEGRKVELVLRTLIPIFSCKTGITGDVVIYGRRRDEGTDTWAECL